MAGQKICTLDHVKCYWDLYGADIIHFHAKDFRVHSLSLSVVINYDIGTFIVLI